MPAASETRPRDLQLRQGRSLPLGGKPLLMGVVNVTPDSFSDGGRFLDPERAIAHALGLVEAGADLLDLGAESTRPGGGVYGGGAGRVDDESEWERLAPVLEALRGRTAVPLSVDTRKGLVAQRALEAGADLINDVSGLQDESLGRAVARHQAPLVLMHRRGDWATMQQGIDYQDLGSEIARELERSVERALRLGVDPGQVVVDPGIGFGKRLEDNLAILRGLPELERLGYPVLIGASRKSFIGAFSGAGVDQRLPGSLAALAAATLAGAAIVRVHDVAESRQFLDLFWAVRGPSQGASE